MIAVAAVVGNSFYDFDLEQWGFKRNNKESWSSYFKRMQSHPAWGTKNIVSWDVSIQGAREINSIATANPEVYYFSFINSNTVLDSSSGRHVPHNSMSFIIRSNARLMGMKRAYSKNLPQIFSTYFFAIDLANRSSSIILSISNSLSSSFLEFSSSIVARTTSAIPRKLNL